MAQKTGSGIFLAVALIAAAVLFYAGSAWYSENTIQFLLEEEEKEQDGMDAARRDGEPKEKAEGASDEQEQEEGETGKTDSICAFVCGSVQYAGIYELAEGARLSDFIKAAGGFSKKAAKEYLNLAEKAQDGQRIYVPSKKEVKKWEKGTILDGSEDSMELAAPDGKININTAGKEELMTLAGIGESKADAIIAYREEQGGFHNVEELMQISGIKEGVYGKICDHITI